MDSDSINAKAEFVDNVSGKNVLCAVIHYDPTLVGEPKHPAIAILPVHYTAKQYHDFLSALDFDYDAGFGWQELYGTVWFDDGTWLERYEYDGKEEWHHKKCPEIPDFLTNGISGTYHIREAAE
jgi:hypothetical protein